MKRIVSVLFMMGAAFGASADLSPAAHSIAEANKVIREKPEQYTSYNLLAMALVHRAQETADDGYYAQAEDAVRKSLELSPHNFDTGKIQVSILLGEHEYPAALEAAKTMNKQVPDDVMVYGLLTDANLALGNYKDAESAAQWMLNLRPGNLPALIRAAHLRELFGDAEGAYELMEMAYQSTVPTETGERASLLTQMGHLRFASGNTDAAEKLFQQALTSLPAYYSALGNLAQVRIAQKRYEEAVVLLGRRYEAAPRAEYRYDLAEALRLAGRADEAQKAFAEFETTALAESSKRQNSNRELIFYYADHAHQPAKALQVAQPEYAWRHDVYTLDAYAWALHVNGEDVEARKLMETALALGIRDASLYRHAGEIALKTEDPAAARRYLKQAAELNSVDAEQARITLAGLAH
ncbi:MAG TPA: tetratricopeptide repeat protein [Bryobacteraceae bacterium]|jgi:tetratricopeptide (TPR) repeat protein|nr:tetratricopeptide repeat protein [Bryobacteraceae bacterium]